MDRVTGPVADAGEIAVEGVITGPEEERAHIGCGAEAAAAEEDGTAGVGIEGGNDGEAGTGTAVGVETDAGETGEVL